MDATLRFLGEIVAYGGGAAVIAYLLFQYFGKTWIENKFAEKLELLRHSQAMELQKLRVNIDSMLSGAIKIQDMEFESLPEAWGRFDRALGLLSHVASPMQEYPDLNRYSSVQLDEYLASLDFADSQKDEIRKAMQMERNNTYIRINYRYRLRDTHNAIADFHNYVEKTKIFIPPDIGEDLSKASEMMWHAHGSMKIGEEAGDYAMKSEAWKKVKEEIQPLRDSISKRIYERLQSHRSTL